MINLQTAKEIATRELNGTYAGEWGPVVILDDYTIEKEYGWIFFRSTQKCAATREFQYPLAGNGPVIVEKADGAIFRYGTANPPEEIIREYE